MIGEPHHLERCFMSDQGSLGARIQAPTTIARSLISTDELLYRTKVPKTKVETQHQNKKTTPPAFAPLSGRGCPARLRQRRSSACAATRSRTTTRQAMAVASHSRRAANLGLAPPLMSAGRTRLVLREASRRRERFPVAEAEGLTWENSVA